MNVSIPFAHNFSFMFTKGQDLFRWIFKIFSPPLAWSQIHSFFHRSFNFFLENLKMCQFCWRFLRKKLTVTAVHVNNACLTQLENLSNTNLWRMIDRVENLSCDKPSFPLESVMSWGKLKSRSAPETSWRNF